MLVLFYEKMIIAINNQIWAPLCRPRFSLLVPCQLPYTSQLSNRVNTRISSPFHGSSILIRYLNGLNALWNFDHSTFLVYPRKEMTREKSLPFVQNFLLKIFIVIFAH